MIRTVSMLLLWVLGWGLAVVQAQTWPTKPLRAIVPFAAGSFTDIVARMAFDQLSLHLGQGIVVENRPGAGGTIGSAIVAKSAPDGYTILVNSNAHTIAPSLYPKLTYHPARDFAAVVPLGISPLVLVVSSAKGYTSVGDFVAAAKAKPGAFNFSSLGIGTATHLSAERFRFSADVQAVHVPFKGGLEAMSEVITGRIDFWFGAPGMILQNVREKKLTPLVVSGSARSAALPDVPTTAEAGFSNAEYPIWFGLFLPALTPREIIGKLSTETLQALRTPKVRDKMVSLSVDPMVMSPSEFDAYIEKGIATDAALVKVIGLKAE
jgi:tripartite-type tricarboxylate transporter receptor subunit TctC